MGNKIQTFSGPAGAQPPKGGKEIPFSKLPKDIKEKITKDLETKIKECTDPKVKEKLEGLLKAMKGGKDNEIKKASDELRAIMPQDKSGAPTTQPKVGQAISLDKPKSSL